MHNQDNSLLFLRSSSNNSNPASFGQQYAAYIPVQEVEQDALSQLHVLPTVPCYLCGIPIQSDKSKLCLSCMRNQTDLTDKIGRQAVVQRCKECLRWKKPPFVHCDLESPQLLALCLKKIKGLGADKDIKVINAHFIWTEPNCKRLKVVVTVQKEIAEGSILEQNVVVDFLIQTMQCDDCKKQWTPHIWSANLQVRQKSKHKRTLLHLEQLILKHDAHDKVIGMEEVPNGIDFQFAHKQDLDKMSNFITMKFASRKSTSKTLVSHDANNNKYNYKYTTLIDICPIIKDDIVCLDPKLANLYGGCCPILLCTKVSSGIHFIEPMTLNKIVISAIKYWRHPCEAIMSREHLSEFMVLNMDIPQDYKNRVEIPEGTSIRSGLSSTSNASTLTHCLREGTKLKFVTGYAEIAKITDLGLNNETCIVKTHLAHIFKPGDYVMGYDMRSTATLCDETQYDTLIKHVNQDVYLVKKSNRNKKQRQWTLQVLKKSKTQSNSTHGSDDIKEFMDEIAENKKLRATLNLYKKPNLQPVAESEEVVELLDGLNIEDDIEYNL